jgi:hypothetical protein
MRVSHVADRTPPTPAEIAVNDQIDASNAAALDRIAAAARHALADGQPRWAVERALHGEFHQAQPGTICTLLVLAVIRQAEHTCSTTDLFAEADEPRG